MCARVCVRVHARLDEGMYFTRPSDMNDYKYSKTASMLGKLVHVIRIFGVFTAIGKALICSVVPLPAGHYSPAVPIVHVPTVVYLRD